MAATRDVLGESGADASMEEIAARAGVGVGTVYRRFASKDALIDELVRLVLSDLLSAADLALDRADGHGLEQFLRAAGAMFAEHSRYASLLLQRSPERETASRIRAAIGELTSRAVLAGTVNPGLAAGDVIALLWAMNRVAENTAQTAPGSWQRFLDVHLAGLRAPGQLSTVEPMPAQ